MEVLPINLVRDYVKANVVRRVPTEWTLNGRSLTYDLYGSNGLYIGNHCKRCLGSRPSMGVIRIHNEEFKQIMQEIKQYNVTKRLNFIDANGNSRGIPSEETIETTVLDFINNKFATYRTIVKLISKLKPSDRKYVIKPSYEMPKEKLRYHTVTGLVREGSISEAMKSPTQWNREVYVDRHSYQSPHCFS